MRGWYSGPIHYRLLKAGDTSVFDPIMPVRFLSDPAFRLLGAEAGPEPPA